MAFFSQLFGIFYFQVVLCANIVFIFAIFVWALKNRKIPACRQAGKNLKIEKLKLRNVDWVLPLVILIAFLTLWQVHFNYTGKINFASDTTVSYHQVKNMKYIYPYFSDEWYAVSLINEAIKNHSLPLTNPFTGDGFLNFEMFFHSFMAGIFLLFGLNPLTNYVLVSLFFNVLIVVLAYLFLRINEIPKLPSAISSLFLLYITSAANLPAFWTFIPANLGIIFCLLGFCFMGSVLGLTPLACGALVALFYPPLAVFYLVALAVHYFYKYPEHRPKSFKIIICSLIFLIPALFVLYVFLAFSGHLGFLNSVFSKIFYRSLTGNYIPQYNFYNIIPWPAILFSIIGLPYVFKNKKWLFWLFILGTIFWIFYVFSPEMFIIEYPRVVLFTSILAVIIAGFGMKKAELKWPAFKNLEILGIIAFLIFLPFYTQRENWQKLILVDYSTGSKIYAKSPANNYLTQDDLKIFSKFDGKRFLSVPWKGTVLGVATKNYPVSIKDGTIALEQDLYFEFSAIDCGQKQKLAKNRNIDYIYSLPFSCQNFEKIDQSSEGFALYKIND